MFHLKQRKLQPYFWNASIIHTHLSRFMSRRYKQVYERTCTLMAPEAAALGSTQL